MSDPIPTNPSEIMVLVESNAKWIEGAFKWANPPYAPTPHMLADIDAKADRIKDLARALVPHAQRTQTP